MHFQERKLALAEIYERFEAAVAPFKADAVCRPGCAVCCTQVGDVDVTTLEGLGILERIGRMPKPMRRKLEKDLARNRQLKKTRNIVRCPFLGRNNLCLIYDVRPFSCRRVYSVETCVDRGPTVHRQAVAMGNASVAELQRLDDTGYSGHISFVLHLLQQADFRDLYLSGGFAPGRIAAYGKAHRIVINRMMHAGTGASGPGPATDAGGTSKTNGLSDDP